MPDSPSDLALLFSGCQGERPPFRVARDSAPRQLAGAIAKVLRQSPCVEIHAIGAEPVYKTVKALDLARTFLSEEQITIAVHIERITLQVLEDERTGFRFVAAVLSRPELPE